MTTVEDGEILEVNNDGVIDLCSDAEPGPAPTSPPEPNSSRSQIRRNISAFRKNIYRGGDPFVYAACAQVDGDRTPPDEPLVLQASRPYNQPNDARNSLNDSLSTPRPYLPNKEPFMQRSTYAPDNPIPSSLHNDVTEPLHAHNQPFLGCIPSRGAMNASPLSAAGRSGDAMWPYPAPHDGPGLHLGPHAESHPASQKSYDPERYSPREEPSRFADGATYHAEPGPPPSAQFAMRNQSMMPPDPSFRGMPFEMTQKQRLHHMNQLHDPPPSMYNHQPFSGIVRTEQGFFTRDTPEVIERYQSKTESVIAFRRERESLQNRHRQFHLKPEISLQQDSYDGRFIFDPQHRSVCDTAIHREVNGFDGSENGRILAEPVRSPVSNEGADRANSTESGGGHERLGCKYGVSRSGDYDQGASVPKREQFQLGSTALKDDASEGEISSPPVPSPVISLATAPDVTPSPPSLTKKKSTGADAKKRLLELRKKALLSVKKRPTAQDSHGSTQPVPPRCSPPLTTSDIAEGLEELQGVRRTQRGHGDVKNDYTDVQDRHVHRSNSSDEVIRGARIQSDSLVEVVVGGVRRTMTRVQFTQWQEWPYQNRIVIDYSSDSSDSTDGSDSEDEGLESNAVVHEKCHRSPAYSREREIEAMKIRMVCLGKCPSMLTGEPKTLRCSSTSSGQQTLQKLGGEPSHRNDTRNVTEVPKESTKPEPGKNHSEHATAENRAVEEEHAFSLEHACASTESRPHAMQPKSTLGHSKNAKPTTVSCRSPVSISSAENRVTSEQPEELELVPADQSEKTKNELVHGDKQSSDETLSKNVNKKETIAPVKSPRPPVVASNEKPIAELKRRIAAIEKSRDQLKQKRQKKQRTTTGEETTGSHRKNCIPRRTPSHRNTSMIEDRKRIPLVSKQEKRGRPTAELDNRERVQYQRSNRYYGPTSSSSLQSLSVLKKEDAVDAIVDVPQVCCDASDSSVRTTVQGAPEATLEIIEDSAQRRYIDDLKLELEEKRKELMDERDHAEQLRTAEVAIAEAQAKLNFTRSRVVDLQEELRKARLDLTNAEKEHQRRIKVATELRDASSEELAELNPEQEYQGRVQYSLEIAGNDDGNVSNHPDIEEGSDIDKGQGEIDDYVLRPSPFTPSTGDYFTSCLRAFRAYAIVIQGLVRLASTCMCCLARHGTVTDILYVLVFLSRAPQTTFTSPLS